MNWKLVENSENLNQMLKVREDFEEIKNSEFAELLLVTHNYQADEDTLFPDVAVLSFFTAFEHNCLHGLDEKNALKFVASNINEGIMQWYLYTKDARKSIHDCIEFLKQNPNFSVEFAIHQDKDWQKVESLYKI